MFRRFLAWHLLPALIASLIFVPSALAAPPSQTGDAPPPGCQWVYSAGGSAPFANLFKDPEDTPLEDLHLGESFGTSPNVARSGHLDFDGDETQDVFRVKVRTDGFLQWQYSPDSRNAWQDLAYAGVRLADLRFGDFNGDGKTDVFAALQNADNGHRWVYSSGGLASFQTLRNISADEAARYTSPRVADFNDDGKADIFVAEPRPEGGWQWKYAPGGSDAFINLAYALVDPADFQFGDFNHDGKSDVFARLIGTDGSQQWVYSSGGAANFQTLQTVSASEVATYGVPRLGDFDLDGKTDIFIATPRSAGGWQWAFAPGGSGAFTTKDMAYSTVPPANLRFGKFEASADISATDLFARLDCDPTPPPPPSPLACGGEFIAVADATLDAGSEDQASGALSGLIIARDNGIQKSALLRFDVAGLPEEATITSAELELPMTGTPGVASVPINVAEVAEAWDESTVTWKIRPDGGYDYGEKHYTTIAGKVRIDVTPLAIRWINDGLPQVGVLLEPGGNADMQLDAVSRENDNTQPKLIVRCTPRYAGNPPGRTAVDKAQQADLERLSQLSTGAPEITFGVQGGVLNGSFQLTIPDGVEDDSESQARWFLDEFKGLLRLSDTKTQLELVQRDDTDSHPRFRQLVDGVPVEGGELAVHLAGKHVIGLTGFYMPDMVPLGAPALDAELAVQLALAHAGNGSTSLGEPQLRYVTEQMFNPAGDPRSRLAWLVSVSGDDGWYYHLVDASSGRMLATLPQQTSVFNLDLRRAFGAGSSTNCSAPLRGGSLWHTEDGRVQWAAPNPDADAAFTAARATYDYWNGTRGIRRDGLDGNGGQANVFVDVGRNWQNAQWNCNQMEFGAGMGTRDIVAHEWGHGIMVNTVFPTYQRESGALNESLADIFGYALDSDDWTIGEGTAAGTMRNMEFPAQFRDPDTMSDFRPFPATATCNTGGNDNCGVHTNSGIHNKAAQLLIAGGEHNGVKVRGISRDKTVALYYNALRFNLISSNATFLEMRDGLLSTVAASRLTFIRIDLGWTYTDADICSIRNAYAAVGVGAGDADCDGVENPGESQWWADADGDNIRNYRDRCPNLASANNNDTDGDGVGDPCDGDDDNDAICDFNGPLSNDVAGVPGPNGCRRGAGVGAGYVYDNCELVPNADQLNLDGDSRGDVCDKDDDGDGRVDALDNCPRLKQGVKKNDWEDYDNDGVGDVCDLDGDNDGICTYGGPLPFSPSFPGVPERGCLASRWIASGAPGDICALKEDPGQEDSTETALGKAADRVGDACDLCPVLSDADNSDTDDDGVGDPCDLDDDNDHICDANGPHLPGEPGVSADPNKPESGCEPGPSRVAAPIQPADNCPKDPNQNQRDDDNNGRGFVCDSAEQAAERERLGQILRGLRFKVRYGAQRFPIPICPQCGVKSLPFRYESVIKVQVPDGYRAQVVDNFGKVMTSSQVAGGLVELRFRPAANAARRIGIGAQGAADDGVMEALTSAAEVTYFLELIPDASLDPELEVETTITVTESIPLQGVFLPLIRR